MLHLNPHHTALNAIRVVLGVMLIFFTANAAPPRYDHVVIVVEENRTSGQIIGDTVNTASRLEVLNKKMGSQLILSSRVAALAGADLAHLPMASVTPRGKEEPIRVYVVKSILEGLADLG